MANRSEDLSSPLADSAALKQRQERCRNVQYSIPCDMFLIDIACTGARLSTLSC